MNDSQNLYKKSEIDIFLSLDALTGLIQQAEATWQPMLSMTTTRNPLIRLKHAFLAKVGLVTSDRYQQQAEFNASVIRICYWVSTTMHQLQHYLQIEREQKRQQQQSLVDTQQSLVDTQQSLVDTQQSLVDTQQSLVDTQQSLVDTQHLLSTLQAQLQENSAIHFRTRSMLQTITEAQQDIPATIKELLAAQQQMQTELQQLQARVEQIQGRVMDHALAQTLFAEQIHILQQVNPASLNES